VKDADVESSSNAKPKTKTANTFRKFIDKTNQIYSKHGPFEFVLALIHSEQDGFLSFMDESNIDLRDLLNGDLKGTYCVVFNE
jgi:hypothetical protein